MKRWCDRPVADIQPEEAAAAIRAIVKRDAPYQAHNAFGYLRRLFNWAIGTHEFGIAASPVERLSPQDLIGKRKTRNRILSDDELRAIWNATSAEVSGRRNAAQDVMGYPYGPLIRMLVLTGQREREVADMTWSEIDFEKALWTIPAERLKGGRAHVVPLPPDALALLRALPRFGAGPYVFTTTDGEKPVNGLSKAKARIDNISVATSPNSLINANGNVTDTNGPDRPNQFKLTGMYILPWQDLIITQSDREWKAHVDDTLGSGDSLTAIPVDRVESGMAPTAMIRWSAAQLGTLFSDRLAVLLGSLKMDGDPQYWDELRQSAQGLSLAGDDADERAINSLLLALTGEQAAPLHNLLILLAVASELPRLGFLITSAIQRDPTRGTLASLAIALEYALRKSLAFSITLEVKQP